MKFVLFLCFLISTESKIVLDIETDSHSRDVSISHSGIDVNIITDSDIDLFKVDSASLKEAVKNHYGKNPKNVYLKSPTPWGDLYKIYKWEQVSRVLSIKSARLKSIGKNPVVIMSQDFENFSNKTIKVNTAISHTVENTLTTSWTKSKEMTVSQEIEYDINVIFAKITGNTGFSYTSSWGESEEKSESVTIGTTSAVETELSPGQAVTAVLSANAGYLEIEVIYKATLRGNLAVNFKNSYNGHHFWGPPIADVMCSGGIVNEIITLETIKLGFHVDGKLEVFDKESGLPV